MSGSPTDSERVAEEHAGQQETAVVSDCESASEKSEGSNTEEQSEGDFEDVSGNGEETEDEELDEDQDKGMGMAMGMQRKEKQLADKDGRL